MTPDKQGVTLRVVLELDEEDQDLRDLPLHSPGLLLGGLGASIVLTGQLRVYSGAQ